MQNSQSTMGNKDLISVSAILMEISSFDHILCTQSSLLLIYKYIAGGICMTFRGHSMHFGSKFFFASPMKWRKQFF